MYSSSRSLLKLLVLVAFAVVVAASPAHAERVVQSLNGIWSVAEGSMATQPADWSRTVPVPGFIDLATPPFEEPGKVTKPYGQRTELHAPIEADARREAFWYKRTFTVPGAVPELAQLKVTRAMYGATVWLNGKEIGSHWPNFTPGYFDLKSALKGKARRMNWSSAWAPRRWQPMARRTMAAASKNTCTCRAFMMMST